MRAAILEAPRQLTVHEVDQPRPGPDDVLLEVEVAGVCGSDVALFLGIRPIAYPVTLGHEAIARVVQPGQSGLEEGTRVVVEPNIPCGRCAICLRGYGNVCLAKRSLGLNAPGVFADRVVVPAQFVHSVPAEIEPRDAVGIEPLAVAAHAFRVGQVSAGDAVVVVGCGTEGLLLTQVAVSMGARVFAADMRPERLAAAEQAGAERTLQVTADETPETLGARIVADWSPVVVFECAGAAPAVELALEAIAPGGRVVLLGLGAKAVPISPLRFVRRGLTMTGSLIYDHPTDFAQAIDLVRTGRVHPSAAVSHVLALDNAADALALVVGGHAGKVLLDISGVLS